ncbi:hypothetical protein COCC4DRAFT_92671, partial [Bipolaris maydis ATCC 48331]|uniref:Uncharacterized protein n=2 Tax=Cochliobolus heterostrophus TaxID=5016 RepID=M2SNA2_COCH5
MTIKPNEVALKEVWPSSDTLVCCGTIYFPPFGGHDTYDRHHDQTDPTSWSTADTLSTTLEAERPTLQKIMDAGGEIDHQVIPERNVDNCIRKKRVVVRVFTKTCKLPEIIQAFTTLDGIYLQQPVDISDNCPYYDFQLLHFGPPDVVKSEHTERDGQEYYRFIHLPKEVVLQLQL